MRRTKMNPVKKLLSTAAVDAEPYVLKFCHTKDPEKVLPKNKYRGDIVIHIPREELWMWDEDLKEYQEYEIVKK
jgi:hypothetical protein